MRNKCTSLLLEKAGKVEGVNIPPSRLRSARLGSATLLEAPSLRELVDHLPLETSARVRQDVEFLGKRYQHDPVALRALKRFIVDSSELNHFALLTDTHLRSLLLQSVPVPATQSKMPKELRIAVLEAQTLTQGKLTSSGHPVRAVQAALNSHPNVLVAPEWFLNKQGSFLTCQEKQALEEQLLQVSSSSEAMVVPGTLPWVDTRGHYHNTALALSKGRILSRYDKQNDGGDEALGQQQGFPWVAGKTPPPVFLWRGLRVGLEICRDHGDGLLRWNLEKHAKPPLDLHLVVAAGVPLMQAHVGLHGVAIVAQVPDIDPIARKSEVVCRLADGSYQPFDLSQVPRSKVEAGIHLRVLEVQTR